MFIPIYIPAFAKLISFSIHVVQSNTNNFATFWLREVIKTVSTTPSLGGPQ